MVSKINHWKLVQITAFAKRSWNASAWYDSNGQLLRYDCRADV